MDKIAAILIGNKYAGNDPNYLKSVNRKFPFPNDSDSIKYVINILQENHFNIKLITWEEYLRNTNFQCKLIIVAQWPLIRTKWEKGTLIDFRKRVISSIENGSSFILIHHFYPEYPFMEILNIDLYENKTTGQLFFQNKRSFNVLNNDS